MRDFMDELFGSWEPIDVRGPQPKLSEVGSRNHAEALRCLYQAQEGLARLTRAFETAPNDAALIQALNAQLGQDQHSAGVAIDNFWNRAECAGEG